MRKFLILYLLFWALPLAAQEPWELFKRKTVATMNSIPGFCTPEKAHFMMDLIRENHCRYCVEVGVFAGRSLLAIAKAVQYNNAGKVFGIDAWDPDEAIQGLNPGSAQAFWWCDQDFNRLYRKTTQMIKKQNLERFVSLVKSASQKAFVLFADETIDFLHLDGSYNAEGAFQDVVNYFPKVKEGGFILLSDPCRRDRMRALVFLLERADILTCFTSSASFFLFRKSEKRALDTGRLFSE
jgi:hypothetical protein